MSQTDPPPDPHFQPSAVPPLVCSTKRGVVYKRFRDVEAEIATMLVRNSRDWPLEKLKNETLVHLIRTLRRSDDADVNVLGSLVNELAKRITGIAKRWARGFNATTTELILGTVGIEIIELVLAERTTRQGEYLECAFADAVKKRAISQAAKHKPLRRFRPFGSPASKDGETGWDGPQAVPDDGPSPEDDAIDSELRARGPELVQRALAGVQDERHRLAVNLIYLQGWPVTDKDPDRVTVSSHFDKDERTIRNWVKKAFSEMRDALGVSL